MMRPSSFVSQVFPDGTATAAGSLRRRRRFLLPSSAALLSALVFPGAEPGRAGQVDLPLPSSSSAASQAGRTMHVLPNGNIVVLKPGHSIPGPQPVENAGAVYLFDGVTLRPLGELTGTTAGDSVGDRGIMILPNGAFLIRSTRWSHGEAVAAGAVTWCAPDGPLPAKITPDNSLVGGSRNDMVGMADIRILSNGNYTVSSPWWDNGQEEDAGAVTWCSGAAGRAGTVSPANSLTGSRAGDQVGLATESGGIGVVPAVTPLVNGNYVVASPWWDHGAVADAGAVTWCDGAEGRTGPVSAANSLVGSHSRDRVGTRAYMPAGTSSVIAVPNGNYLVRSREWHEGRGAVTWGSGTTGVTGEVSALNSLVGDSPEDYVGADGVELLGNGNYFVRSLRWSPGEGRETGAVTWGSGATGVTGEVSAENSLVGGEGSPGLDAAPPVILNERHCLLVFPEWNRGRGAVVWCDAAVGVRGVISEETALVGSYLPGGGISAVPLANGNYVVHVHGVSAHPGLVAWMPGDKPRAGVIAAADSLSVTHSTQSYPVKIIPLKNGNYLVSDPWWWGVGGTTPNAGALTWCGGTQGRTGEVSAETSLIGTATYDRIGLGGVTLLENGNYVALSPAWKNGRGAATWGRGDAGVTGEVSEVNSLTDSHSFEKAGAGIVALPGGNYVVSSPGWNGSRGAATWGDGAAGTTGPVSAENSLTGSRQNDKVGSSVRVLTNGNYTVHSPFWNEGRGAATWGGGAAGVRGEITEGNSLVGLCPPGFSNGSWVSPLSDGGYTVGIRLPSLPDYPQKFILGDGQSGTRGTVTEDSSLLLPVDMDLPPSGWASAEDAANSRLMVWSIATGRVILIGHFPEMAVRSGAWTGTVSGTAPVPHGQTAPQADNGTDFGPATAARDSVERAFTILNTGMEPLRLTGSPPVTVDGPHAADFTVSALAPALPASGALAPAGDAAEFRITFKPSAPGPRRAVVTIPNDDRDESPYTFAVQGLGLDPDGPGGSGDGVLADWRARYFGNASAGTGSLEDFDSDGVANLLEFAFGTHPAGGGGAGGEGGDAGAGSGPDALRYTGPLTGGGGGGTLVSTGQPVLARLEDGSLTALFIRRKDRAEAGLDYQPQFTTDPAAAVWTAITAQPAVLAGNGLHEVVSVPLPAPAEGVGVGFFRVRVEEG